MDYTLEEKHQIIEAKSSFFAMAATYCLGVFNDNYFKQATLLMAVVAGLNSFQGTATIFFSLPFVLFSAYAGWLADKYSKRIIVINSKFLEIVAMIIGAIGILTENWNLMLAMIFIMALQSTIFGPALNGSIPDLFPQRYVPKANAILKLLTSLSILLGISLSGLSLDATFITSSIPAGKIVVAMVVLLVSIGGFIFSFKSVKKEATPNNDPFPWLGPIISLQHLYQIRKDISLIIILFSSLFFYFFSSLLILLINNLGINQLLLSQTQTSILTVSLMVGVSIGTFISAKISLKILWYKILPPAALGMSCSSIILGLTPLFPLLYAKGLAYLLLTFTGIFGGIFLIPVTSFLQTHPAKNQRGKILGVSYFLDFCGILLSGPIFLILNTLSTSSSRIMILGIFSIGFAILLYSTQKYIQQSTTRTL